MSASPKPHKIGVSITFIGDTLQGRVKWDVRCPDYLLPLHLEMLADAVNETLAKVRKREAEEAKKFEGIREASRRGYYRGRE